MEFVAYINLDGKKGKVSRASTIGLISKALDFIQMLSPESRFPALISKESDLDLHRLHASQTPNSALIKIILPLGLAAQLKLLDA